MSQGNYLALDIGEKRIGLAVGVAVPFGRGYLDATNTEDVLSTVQRMIKQEDINKIIVGVPIVRSGKVTASQKNALDWIERLKERVHVPIESVDESFTSHEAENQLKGEKVDVKQDKGRVDERAAQLILAQYLNEHRA